jgi:hypothetical protein
MKNILFEQKKIVNYIFVENKRDYAANLKKSSKFACHVSEQINF